MHYFGINYKTILDLSCFIPSNSIIFSSPEHKVLMVSYCDWALSVVVRRPSSVNFFT